MDDSNSEGTDRSDGMFGQERENKTRDVVVLLVQGKMAGVEQVDFGIRQTALERLRTGSDERGIVPPPDHQNRGLVLTQPCLPRGRLAAHLLGTADLPR